MDNLLVHPHLVPHLVHHLHTEVLHLVLQVDLDQDLLEALDLDHLEGNLGHSQDLDHLVVHQWVVLDLVLLGHLVLVALDEDIHNLTTLIRLHQPKCHK